MTLHYLSSSRIPYPLPTTLPTLKYGKENEE